jgi:hypothetical protein
MCDNSDTLDYSEFVQGIQVIYFAMNTIFEAKCTGLFCIFEISIIMVKRKRPTIQWSKEKDRQYNG